MNLFHLRCFQVVAHENHITRASQKLNIAQPALSTNIAKLEKEMGVQLFDRIGRQIVLNECGRLLLEHVDVMLGNWDDACNKVEQYKREHRQQIKIASTGILFPQRLIRDFKLDHPDITIKQSNILVDELLPSLIHQKCDFAISSLGAEHEDIESTLLKNEPLYLLANRDHPLAKRESVGVEDLQDQPFIALPEGYAFRKTLDEWFEAAGQRQNVVFECFPSQFSDLVGQNIGLAFASESTVHSDFYPPEVVAVPIVPPLVRSLYILHNKTTRLSAASKAFYKYTLSYGLDP